MNRLFTVYDKRKEYGQVGAEWYFNKGGYFSTDFISFTFCHRFFTVGQVFLGTEKEFILRFQVGFERENKMSWFTIELLNLFEGRWFYFWVKVWKNITFKMTFNFGFRYTKAARDVKGKLAMDKLRILSRKNNGGSNATANSQIRSR